VVLNNSDQDKVKEIPRTESIQIPTQISSSSASSYPSIVGAAFGKIVSSFVGDVITPPRQEILLEEIRDALVKR
jgi:hypothetical protein